jgi:hypothetical protein
VQSANCAAMCELVEPLRRRLISSAKKPANGRIYSTPRCESVPLRRGRHRRSLVAARTYCLLIRCSVIRDTQKHAVIDRGFPKKESSLIMVFGRAFDSRTCRHVTIRAHGLRVTGYCQSVNRHSRCMAMFTTRNCMMHYRRN